VVGELSDAGILEVKGLGSAPSTGMRRGSVVNIEATLRSISQAVEAAELMSGREVSGVFVGIGGTHIQGINSRGVVAITGRGKEVTRDDVGRVIEAARAVNISMDREVLHVIPQVYVVDSQQGIKNPLDMIGVRLEAEVHIVTGDITAAQNLIKCVNRAGFRVDALVLQGLAAARSCLSPDEMELGVLLVDLGAGTTNAMIFRDGAPYFSGALQVGGAQVTSDISRMIATPIETAEKIKIQAGCCLESLVDPSEDVVIPGVAGRPPVVKERTYVASIIEPRMREIFTMVRDRVEREGFSKLGAGVVISGGGANMVGVCELASQVFDCSVRVGSPLSVGGLVEDYKDPVWSTAVGLALYGAEHYVALPESQGPDKRQKSSLSGGGLDRLKDWFKEFF
jgi:cell division protein FtsA